MSSNVLPASALPASESSEFDIPSSPQGNGTHAAVESVFGRDYLRTLKTLQHQMLVQGKQVFDLSMVNPDMPPPRAVLDRLLESVTKTQNHRYAVSRGVRR